MINRKCPKYIFAATLAAVTCNLPVYANPVMYDGTASSQSVVLSDIRSHTIYKEEQVPDTCYRTIQTGTRTQCDAQPDRQECQTTYREECSWVSNAKTSEARKIASSKPPTIWAGGENGIPKHEEPVGQPQRPPEPQRPEPQRPPEPPRPQQPPSGGHNDREDHRPGGDFGHGDRDDHRPVGDFGHGDRDDHRPGGDFGHGDRDDHRPGGDWDHGRPPHRECHTVPFEQCISIPVAPNCYEVAVTAEQPYSCMRTVQTPVGTAVDKKIDANVTVKFAEAPENLKLAETFDVRLMGEQVALELVSSSNQALIVAAPKVSFANPNPKHEILTAEFDVKSISRGSVVGAINSGVKNVRMEKQVLKFQIGKLELPQLLAINLDFSESGWFGSTLFSGNLTPDQISVTSTADGSDVAIDLSHLTLAQALSPDNDYTAVLKLSINKNPSIPGLMNAGIIPDANAEFKATIKLSN